MEAGWGQGHPVDVGRRRPRSAGVTTPEAGTVASRAASHGTADSARDAARQGCGSGTKREQRGQTRLSEHAKRISRRFDGDIEAIATAREQVRAFLADLTPPPPAGLVSDALIAVSELVTNAIRHAPGPFGLEVEVGPEGLCIGVSDTSTTTPQPRTPRYDGTGGFGLHMLSGMAGDVQTRLHPGGKTVSVRMTTAASH